MKFEQTQKSQDVVRPHFQSSPRCIAIVFLLLDFRIIATFQRITQPIKSQQVNFLGLKIEMPFSSD
ncbi:MAG: hypothetical protein CK425_01270 [Parachlamydia sp.]|nr:MAG: hypothetical protein CK425_01270 [Parachlamydia sp.]